MEAEAQGINPTTETQGAGTPAADETAYCPRPPKPFVSRGGSGKHAGRHHEYYLRKREKILTERHNKNMKAREERAEPTTKEQQASHRRRSDAAKRWQKEMSSEAKAASRRRMDAGRAVQLARYKAERREWEAIRLRLNGASLIEIAEKLGFGKSPVRVRTAVHSVDLPESKRYLFDRGQLFTRGTGVQFYKSLRQSYAEFAALISEPGRTVRARRIKPWFTNSGYCLDPRDAQACIGLRDRVAKELLAKDTRRLGFDSYSRPEVLAALFPRYREEYQLLRATLPSLRTFLESNSGAGEPEIAAFVIGEAQREKTEKSKSRAFRELVRWLPGLMTVLIRQKTGIAGDLVINRLAVELLAETIGVSLPIVRHVINRRSPPMPPERMRDLLRLCPELAQPTPAARSKAGAPKKEKQQFEVFGEQWEQIIPRFEQGKRLARDGVASLRAGNFSDLEIDCIMGSRNAKTAAIRWISKKQGMNFQTGKNYVTRFLASKPSRSTPARERTQ
jgi:hypothetical protein